MATNTQTGSDQISFGTVINKTGLTQSDIEVTQRFIDSRKATSTVFTIRSTIAGTFVIESLMKQSDTWVDVMPSGSVSHAASATVPTIWISKAPLGISRLSFTVTGSTDASAVIEIQARSVPR
tara:strand:+ start:206 stop:574 length:369 start_codon:yes stop_codon:yes gene_type:complete